MSDVRFYARAVGDPAVIADVARLLVDQWDPAGRFEAPDGTRSPESHARAVLGILGTGFDLAAVSGYLRRAEEAALGAAESDGRLRSAVGRAAWDRLCTAAIAAARDGRLVT